MTRTLAHLWIGIALVACSCNVVELIPNDAGSSDIGDAGIQQGADAGSGTERDAGEVVDGGTADAGTDCVFDQNDPVPFSCEGDEDFCDLVGEVPEPAGDILAAWSRVEGSEFVIDIRFSAPPFRRIDFELVRLLFEHDTEPAVVGASNHPDPLISRTLAGGFQIDLLNDDGTDREGYPPYVRTSTPHAYDFCGVSLGIVAPMMQFRVPVELAANADDSIRYALQVATPNVDGYSDVSWGDTLSFTTSAGGTPDDLLDLVGICEIDCNDGAFP